MVFKLFFGKAHRYMTYIEDGQKVRFYQLMRFLLFCKDSGKNRRGAFQHDNFGFERERFVL